MLVLQVLDQTFVLIKPKNHRDSASTVLAWGSLLATWNYQVFYNVGQNHRVVLCMASYLQSPSSAFVVLCTIIKQQTTDVYPYGCHMGAWVSAQNQ